MRKKLSKKPELADKMIPSWPVGCRRLTPGVGYLEALVEDKVDTVFGQIANFDATGIIMKDGGHRAYDAIICATGFNVSYKSRFPFVGRDGAQLDEEYAENPYSYLAIGVPGFPNYFCFNGPNAPVGVGSLIPATEAQGEYIVNAIIKFQTQDIKSMMPSYAATKKFVEHTDKWMPRSVWSAGCRSWYKNHKIDGRVTALWPGSGLHYVDALSQPRWEDYEYTYVDSNPFSYLGDGFTHIEHTGEDRTWDIGIRTNRMKSHPALQKHQSTE